jgi:hypothetical protein
MRILSFVFSLSTYIFILSNPFPSPSHPVRAEGTEADERAAAQQIDWHSFVVAKVHTLSHTSLGPDVAYDISLF